MNHSTEHDIDEGRDLALERAKALEARRRQVMAIEPDKAMAAILDEPRPAVLVHSFAAEDLYLLIHEIGPNDSLPLLALASADQIQHILDREIWTKDGLAARRLKDWLTLVVRADARRATTWLMTDQRELTDYFLSRFVEVRIRAHDEDPTDFGKGFVTFDNVFYFRPVAGADKSGQEDFFPELLRRMAAIDLDQYHGILLESQSVIPAEYEEEALRLKNVRLAEKGLLPFEQAVGVYQPLSPERFASRPAKRYAAGEPDWLPLPLATHGALAGRGRFGRCLGLIGDETALRRVEAELAGLCNQVIVADQAPIRTRGELAPKVKKVCGYLDIGLETLAGQGRSALARSADLVQTYPLVDIFRVGYGRAAALTRRAKVWRRAAWFTAQGFPLSLWDEQGLGVIGGLLLPRPLCYDPAGRHPGHYREFATLADIAATDRVLDELQALDRLLSQIPITIGSGPDVAVPLTWKSLVLTLWARHLLGLEPVLAPLSLAELRRFFGEIWTRGRPRRIRTAAKTLLLDWLADTSGQDRDALSADLAPALEALCAEIEDEYAAVAPKDLDSRFVPHFLVMKDEKGTMP